MPKPGIANRLARTLAAEFTKAQLAAALIVTRAETSAAAALLILDEIDTAWERAQRDVTLKFD